jgi:twitching motility protein PilU
MDIMPYFKMMVDLKASDLFFAVGAVPHIKIEGQTKPIDAPKMMSHVMSELVHSLMSDSQQKEFEHHWELNMAISLKNLGRFRANIYRQRGELGMVIRYIKREIPSLESLNLPPVLKKICMELRGLVLIVGATSSGKSTTLASMVDYRNANAQGHILTIEDPIEYLYQHRKSIISQREVGFDTKNYQNALENAMREAPDVIVIGEVRDQSTMKQAITYAGTGMLCKTTIHANNAYQAIERIVNFFPDDARQQVLQDLSLNLRAIVSIRLIPGLEESRVPAVEVLLNTPYVSDLIEKGKIDELKEVMGRSREQGMVTFDQSLYDLYKAKKIGKDDAIRFADSKNNVSLQIRLSEEGHLPQNDDLQVEEDETSRRF